MIFGWARTTRWIWRWRQPLVEASGVTRRVREKNTDTHPIPWQNIYNAIECAEKLKIKVSSTFVYHGAKTDVTCFSIDKARAFLEHIKRLFRLKLSKSKCSEICSLHNFSRQVRFRVWQNNLFWGKQEGKKCLPWNMFFVGPGFGFVSSNHAFYMFQNLLFLKIPQLWTWFQ